MSLTQYSVLSTFFPRLPQNPPRRCFHSRETVFLTNTAGKECDWNGTPDDFQPTSSGSSVPRVSRVSARAGFSEELQRRAERLDQHRQRFGQRDSQGLRRQRRRGVRGQGGARPRRGRGGGPERVGPRRTAREVPAQL